MASNNTKLTDENLKLLYHSLLKHYDYCVHTRHMQDALAVYDEMYLAVQYALESPLGSLHELENSEKRKVYTAFNTIFRALPLYTGKTEAERRAFKPVRPPYNPQVVYAVREHNCYNCHDSTLFNWLLLSSIMDHHHHIHHYPTGGIGLPVHHHGGGSCIPSSDDLIKYLVLLLLIALAAIAAVLTLIALYYMLDEFLEGMERFYYNEGWLRAALIMASSIGFGYGSTMFSLTALAPVLSSLAIIAGLSPFAVVLSGAVMVTIIGAGIGAFAMSFLHDSISSSMNQSAMDPLDPSRFRLTYAEEQNLRKANIDPIKVKCAMIALRVQIGKEIDQLQKSESHQKDDKKAVPSFFQRHYGNGERIQELLQQVRDLRAGHNVARVSVAGLEFDCRVSGNPQGTAPTNRFHAANFPDPSAPEELPPSYSSIEVMSGQHSHF